VGNRSYELLISFWVEVKGHRENRW
jgi:hypothetical protein